MDFGGGHKIANKNIHKEHIRNSDRLDSWVPICINTHSIKGITESATIVTLDIQSAPNVLSLHDICSCRIE